MDVKNLPRNSFCFASVKGDMSKKKKINNKGIVELTFTMGGPLLSYMRQTTF